MGEGRHISIQLVVDLAAELPRCFEAAAKLIRPMRWMTEVCSMI